MYGTPAEEGGGGKIKMIEQNVFDEADVCMMVHPAAIEIPAPIFLAADKVNFVFQGEYDFLDFVYFLRKKNSFFFVCSSYYVSEKFFYFTMIFSIIGINIHL